MKAQAKEEKLLKEKERLMLLRERQAREQAEKEKNELLDRLNRLEGEASKAREGMLIGLSFIVIAILILNLF
jgi:hypothetical protein